jgi:hypothetical protein
MPETITNSMFCLEGSAIFEIKAIGERSRDGSWRVIEVVVLSSDLLIGGLPYPFKLLCDGFLTLTNRLKEQNLPLILLALDLAEWQQQNDPSVQKRSIVSV